MLMRGVESRLSSNGRTVTKSNKHNWAGEVLVSMILEKVGRR